MRIVYFGDVVGKSGRNAIKEYVPYVKNKYNVDFVIVNGENSAHGFGITQSIAEDFF